MRWVNLLLSFKGRIGRPPYVFVAAPILILFALRPVWAGWWLPVMLHDLGLGTTSMQSPFVIIVLASYLLLVPLLAVSFKRLHDLGRSGLWSLPYAVSAAPPLLVAVSALATGAPIGLDQVEWLRWIAWASFYYGLALALVLTFMPGRASVSNGGPAAASSTS